MNRLADLLNRLNDARADEDKIALLVDYLANTPDPDRGWGLAGLVGALNDRCLTGAAMMQLASDRVDPMLLDVSLGYVGDPAETLSLVWPGSEEGAVDVAVSEFASVLKATSRARLIAHVPGWLDRLTPDGRYLLLQLITKGVKPPVPLSLLRVALERYGHQPLTEIEEIWFGVTPPYRDLLEWLDGCGARPEVDKSLLFRSLCPLTDVPLERLEDLEVQEDGYFLESWPDGVRALLSAKGGKARLYTQDGEEIGGVFPEIVDGTDFTAILDGVLVPCGIDIMPSDTSRPKSPEAKVPDPQTPDPFTLMSDCSDVDGSKDRGKFAAAIVELRRRLGRKSVSGKTLTQWPVQFLAADVLEKDGSDERKKPLSVRRAVLNEFVSESKHSYIDLIAVMENPHIGDVIEALKSSFLTTIVLKRNADGYGTAGSKWYRVKNPPRRARCILMSVQGKSNWVSTGIEQLSVGIWQSSENGGRSLVPLAKVAPDCSEEELARIAAWVNEHATERYGSTQYVKPGLLVDIFFDAVERASRRKSGISLRSPRFVSLPTQGEADTLDQVTGTEDSGVLSAS